MRVVKETSQEWLETESQYLLNTWINGNHKTVCQSIYALPKRRSLPLVAAFMMKLDLLNQHSFLKALRHGDFR